MNKTIVDIAKLAGVSKSTVSRYVNGVYISEKNREKVKVAIEETGYRTNFFAKRLKSKKSNLIGLVVPRMESFTANRILRGVADELAISNYELFISISNLKVNKELEFIEKFNNLGVDGIIVLATQITNEHYKLIEKLNIPVLFVGQEDDQIESIFINDKAMGKLMGDYIKEMGHTDIVYLGVSEEDKAVGVNRKEGFMESFENHDSNITFVETDFTFKKAYSIGNEIMKHNPSAIVCSTDNIAIAIIKYLHENNINIPNEVSVTGFGNYEYGVAMHPALTTVTANYIELGKLSAKNIIALIENEEIDSNYDIEIELIKRDSVSNISYRKE